MGLFTNKDKTCPICGKGTPRILPTKIEGSPICSDCNSKILADDGMVKSWTLDDLKAHLQYRSENKKMIDNFKPTRTLNHEREIVIDDVNQLFYIKSWVENNPQVIKFSDIMGFNIQLGLDTVESWCKGMQRTPFQPSGSGILGGIAALASLTGVGNSDKDESVSEDLKVILQLDTPYLHQLELCSIYVSGSNRAAYMDDLCVQMSKVNPLCNLLVSFTQEADKGSAGASGSASAQSDVPTDTDQIAEDLKKYKGLMDAGVITAEEFEAKKKQLLGI